MNDIQRAVFAAAVAIVSSFVPGQEHNGINIYFLVLISLKLDVLAGKKPDAVVNITNEAVKDSEPKLYKHPGYRCEGCHTWVHNVASGCSNCGSNAC